MVEIIELKEASEKALAEINNLIHQLSPRLPDCSMELLQKIVKSENHELWTVSEEGIIVGMATLAMVVIPEGERAQIEDVVVDESQRGKGLGQKLTEKLIERARARKAGKITLSSRAERVAANGLYQKLGFTQRPTNVYQMNL